MSVLECSRHGCRNIMCDMMIEGRYVCGSCAEEFRVAVGNGPMPIRELSKMFQAFMESEKSAYDNQVVTVDEFLGLESWKCI